MDNSLEFNCSAGSSQKNYSNCFICSTDLKQEKRNPLVAEGNLIKTLINTHICFATITIGIFKKCIVNV